MYNISQYILEKLKLDKDIKVNKLTTKEKIKELIENYLNSTDFLSNKSDAFEIGFGVGESDNGDVTVFITINSAYLYHNHRYKQLRQICSDIREILQNEGFKINWSGLEEHTCKITLSTSVF